MKRYILGLAFFLVGSISFAQITRTQADEIISAYIEQEIKELCLWYLCSDTLSEEVTIVTWHDTLVTSDTYVYFIDEDPYANWAHDCRYVFVSKTDGTYQIVKATSPAVDTEWILKSSPLPVSESALFDFTKRGQRKSSVTETGPAHSYAVIINGGKEMKSNEERYWNNCAAVYQALVYVYGYFPDHIYVLMADGTNPANDRHRIDGDYDSSPLDLDNNGTDDIQYAATKANVSFVFDELSRKLTEKDNLFVFVTGHGDPKGISVLSWLWNKVEMLPNDFALEVNKVKAGTINILMSQCYSGGFIPVLRRPGVVISTACSGTEQSYAHSSLKYDEYVYHWVAAVTGTYPLGGVANADKNADGFVSMREAYQYAFENDAKRPNETPLYSSESDYVGKDLTLLGLEACTPVLFDIPVSSDKEVKGCDIKVKNASVKNGAKLIINARSSITIEGSFTMEPGTELETK